MIYGYARVSTKGQARDGNSLEQQRETLMAHGAEKVYVDSFTGTKMERPQFKELLDEIKAGDTLIVTKLDRFARSVSEASTLITELVNAGVKVDVCNLGVLDNSSVSVLIRNILLSFAQFERDMILERTREGKEMAKKDPNWRDGRPKKFSRAHIALALELLKTHTYAQVVDMTGISESTIRRAKRKSEN